MSLSKSGTKRKFDTVSPAVPTEQQSSAKRAHTARALNVYGADSSVMFQEKKHIKLDSDVQITPKGIYVCDGSTRERIIINLESKELQPHFDTFLKEFDDSEQSTQPVDDEGDSKAEMVVNKPAIYNRTPIELLKFISAYVNKFLSASDEAMHSVFKDTGKQGIFIPLHVFLERKAGVCRQKALFTIFLFVKTMEYIKFENYRIFRFRTDLFVPKEKPLGHSVVVCEMDGKWLMIDSTRIGGLVLDITDPSKIDKKDLECYLPYDGLRFVEEIHAHYSMANKIVSRTA